jgi:hypothetical protein
MVWLLGLLKNPIVQWGLAILGAFLGYQAWKYYQQNVGAQKQIDKQKKAAQIADDLMKKAKVPKTDTEVEDDLKNGRF